MMSGCVAYATSRQTPLSSSHRSRFISEPGPMPSPSRQRSRFIWKGQWSRFMWDNGPGYCHQPGPMLWRPTRGALRGIGPGLWQQPGPLPWLYKPPSQHFAQKIPGLCLGGVGARIFSLIAHQVFDEMSKPHLGPQNTVSSAEVSNLIFSICN